MRRKNKSTQVCRDHNSVKSSEESIWTFESRSNILFNLLELTVDSFMIAIYFISWKLRLLDSPLDLS